MLWIYSLVSVVLVSLISLAGILTIVIRKEQLGKILNFLVAFAVGALFGDAFIHLLPEAFEKIPSHLLVGLDVIAGFLLFFMIEKFIRWRHFTMPHTEHVKPVVALNLIGDAVHNFIDGMLIAGSFMVDFHVGIATTIAIVLHEIPQELGDFAILIKGGLSVKKALMLNLLTALTAVAGTVMTLVVGSFIGSFSIVLLPITAGSFLYIAGPDLIPELHAETKPSSALWQFIAIVVGVGIMVALTLLE